VGEGGYVLAAEERGYQSEAVKGWGESFDPIPMHVQVQLYRRSEEGNVGLHCLYDSIY